MPTPRRIQQIREQNGGLDNLTDYEIAQLEFQDYSRYYDGFDSFAKDIGFDTGSKWGNRLSASVDNYQAGLLGLGEAVTGSETLGRMRRSNEMEALNAQQLATSQGAVSSYKDVNGVGDALDYVGGLAVDSLPYLGEALVGGLAGRGLAAAGRLGLSRSAASAAGAAAASYPSAVGDILQSQRDQAGETNLGAAAALGVPYAAANAIGLEGLAARATLPRNAVRSLDLLDGTKGVLARTTATGLRTGVGESVSETSQEGMNQLGRMAVDPNEAFLSDPAQDRFAESAVGGFALGGAGGAALGGWRRSQDGTRDLLNPDANPEQGGVTGSITGTDVTSLLGNPLGGMQALGIQAPLLNNPAQVEINTEAPVGASALPGQNLGGQSLTGNTGASLLGAPAVDETPQGETAQPGASLSPRVQAIKEQVEATKRAQAELSERAAEFGIKGTSGVSVYESLENMLNDGSITDDQFAQQVGLLAARRQGDVKSFIKGLLAQRAELEASSRADEQAKVDAISKLQKGAANAQPQAQPDAAGVQAGAEAPGAVVPGNPAAAPGIGQSDAAAQSAVAESPATVTVGRKGREKVVTREQLGSMLASAPPADRRRIMDVMGYDETTDPDTGAPKFVQVANPRTMEQVAQIESQRTGNTVTKQAIQQTLVKYGIDMNAVNAATGMSANTVTEAELGIDPEADASGFRVETELSKATGQGLVDDGTAPTKAQAALIEQADKALAGDRTVEPDTYDAEGDTTRAEREARARAEAEQSLIEAMEAPTADAAVVDWNDGRPAGAPEFDALTTGEKLEYLDLYEEQVDETGSEWEPIERLIETFAREIGTTQSRAPGRAGQNDAGAVAAQSREARADGQAQSRVPGTVQDPGQVAWDALRATVPQMPEYSTLNERQQKQVRDLVQRDVFNLAAANTVASNINQDVLGPEVPLNRDVLQSRGRRTQRGSTVEAVTEEAKRFLRLDTLGRSVKVVENLDTLPAGVNRSVLSAATQGVAITTDSGRAEVYLIASQIEPGKVRSVFLHEVGAHIGLERMLTREQFKTLTDQIIKWARAYDDGSEALEHQLASLAIERTVLADVKPEDRRSEILAYFIEEAVDRGVDPTAETATGPIARFLSQVMRAFNAALTKLGIKPEALTAQDVVDLAYGAASLEMRDGITPEAEAPRVRQSVARSSVPQIDAIPKAVSSFTQSLKDGASWLGVRAMFTEDLVNLASKVIPSARLYKAEMDKVEVERGRMERDVVRILQDFRALPAHEQGTGPTSVNAILRDSTIDKKWAFEPEWVSGATVDPVLKGRFDRLSKPAQDLVKRVFKHGHDTLQQMQKAVVDNVTSEFDGDIAEFDRLGKKPEADKLRRKKAKYLADFQSLMDMRGNWPYAPLKRFGRHVVMGVSKAYQDAKDAGDTARMQALQKDGDHYFVAFAETKREARRMVEEMRGSFPDGNIGTFEKLDGVDEFMGGRDVLSAFQRLRKMAAEQTGDSDSRVNDRVNTLMRQLYLTLLSETSARKGELHRKGVAGADKDMMRAFATQGRATAHFVAGLKTNGKITDHLRDMKRQVSATLGDREKKQAYFNEIMRRHSMNLEYSPSGLIDKAMAGTSVWMLLTNPSYFLINATQPWMMSVPLMAGRHGYAKSQTYLMLAMRDLAPILRDGQFSEEDYRKLPQDVRSAIEELANQGVIDISLESVLGNFESGTDSPLRHFDTAVQKLRNVAQTVESMNRLATAMSAYRMERERGSSHAQAVAYAAKVIYETHGDYSGFNAPRFMRQGVGRLATQFRKFQLIQLSMFARLLHGAFKGASADERFVAKKALALQLTHLFAAGGLMGLPGFAAIAWLTGLLMPDDDEPDDPEATLRRLIGDKDLADLLLKGAPKLAGVDISGRVGAGGMLSILPYTDIEVSREGYSEIVTGLLGPLVGGLLPRAVDGVSLIAGGDIWRGAEALLPGGLANALKGARLATEGVTKRNGDVVLSADEVGLVAGLSQALGLPANALTDRQFLANAQYKSDTFYRERTTELKNAYAKAVRDNDTARMAEVRDEWMSTQAARKRLGYDTQPLSTLLKAPREQAKRERDTEAGVQFTRNNRGFTSPLVGE